MNSVSTLAGKLQALHERGDNAAVVAMARADMPAVDRDTDASFYFGLAAASTGAFAEAATALGSVLRDRPSDAMVKGALARVLILTGRRSECERLIGELTHAAKSDPVAADSLADALLQDGRHEQAFQVLAEAAEKFQSPRFDAKLAEAAIRTRRIDAGVDAARRAESRLGLHPSTINAAGPAAILAGDRQWLVRLTGALRHLPAERAAGVHDFWTGVLMSGDHLRAARDAAAMAADCAPTAMRWRLLCDLSLALHDIAGAEAAALAALDLAPSDADAHSLLARCKIFAGDIEEAKRLLRLAVSIDPDSAVAFDNLTQLEPAAMTNEMATHLERRIASGGFVPNAKAKALLALARKNEVDGDHALAFERVLAAKKIVGDAAKAAGRPYRPAATDAHVEAMKRLFPVGERTPRSHDGPPGLIFVVGMPRSGTSLVEQILSSHSRVFGAGELTAMVTLMNEFTSCASTIDRRRVIAENAAGWARRYLDNLPTEARGAAYVVDKHPLNFWSVGLIFDLFPDARIVNLKRPAVDVCLSILRVRFFADYDFANDIDSVAHYFAAYDRMLAHWRAIFGDRIYDVDYEGLVADPARAVRSLLDYCGLPFESACLSSHSTTRSVMTHSAAQVREPINTKSIERRRRYGDALRPLEHALARYGVQTR